MYKISWWNTTIGDEESLAISKAIQNKQIGMGSITKAFENDIATLLNVPYVVATPSGSVALYMALMVLGIGKGDEVIIPDRTFIATAHAVKLTGAKVILVDVNKYNTNINIDKIEEQITNKTKMILPVHLNGRAVDMKAINKLAKKYNLKVIEDACQSFLSKDNKERFLGTLSLMGCFSLGLSKLITVGQGGFIVCHNNKIYQKLLRFRDHGKLNKNDLLYDKLGFNFKVSDIIMSIGRIQLRKYKEKIKHCIYIYKLYRNAIDNLDFINLINVTIKQEIPLYIEVVSPKRELLIKLLLLNNIEINYLPPSLHISKHLKQKTNNFKNSLYFNNNSFILPCGPNQKIANVKKVIKILYKFKG